jgi:hypothetical protein
VDKRPAGGYRRDSPEPFLNRYRHPTTRLWVAVLAAYVLVLQGIVGAAASGRSLAPTLLDRTIHLTLCAPGADATPLPDGSERPHLPPCCLLGCAASAALAAPPPARSPLVLPDRPALPAVRAPERIQPSPPLRVGVAARPRGPPSLA